MRVLICPDKFAGTLSASAAAVAIAEGWTSAVPGDRLVCKPLADGGPGFLDVIAESVAGVAIPVSTCDPLGRTVSGSVLLAAETGYVESAQACGLHLLTVSERDPKRTTSYGLGLLIAAAVESGARQVVVGLGGSATNDAGAGMLAALDAAPVDAAGVALPYGGAALVDCHGLTGPPRLRGARLVAATDVDNPLLGVHGATAIFGPQKGAGRADVLLLDQALERFATVLREVLPECPPDVAELAGAGAAGGVGAALYALGADRQPGMGLVRRIVGLDQAMAGVDLVITGEGSFDAQSLRGKVVAGVADTALSRGLPCVVIAGQVNLGRRDIAAAGIAGAYSVADHVGGVEHALAFPAAGLRSLAAWIARQWPPSGEIRS
ncbi:MAG TPA: glycerate kinase [Micromonosporaceae bacterium]|nr:glycerate kinase [Micromonosporaceae bacterium]